MHCFALTDTFIDTEAQLKKIQSSMAGAYSEFKGTVRNHNDGRQVDSLEYQAYEALSLKEGELILNEALKKFDILHAACIHRTGHLELQELAVWVGTASKHRQEAFDATIYIIDEVKARLPIWKKEYYSDGRTEWVNCQRCALKHTL